MNKKTICIIICMLNLPAAGIDYNDFPPDLQQISNERIAELESKGGLCVAGRITMSDEAHISSGKDVKVNFIRGADESLWVYDGGRFIMGRTVQNFSYPGPAKISIRAFGYDPIDASIAVREKQITYMEFELRKTPTEKLATIAGTIVNNQNEPIEGVMVNISFPLSYDEDNGQPHTSMKTEPDGSYSFEGLTATEYYLRIPEFSEYAKSTINATPIAGRTTTKNLKLCRKLRIVIDYVYQADGSRSFIEGDLKKGTFEWSENHKGFDFSEEKLEDFETYSPRDLEMSQNQDKMSFYVYLSHGQNGFYDAGKVDFESVIEAGETGYSTNMKLCVAGHTYIVKTFEKNYAKFVVRNISRDE